MKRNNFVFIFVVLLAFCLIGCGTNTPESDTEDVNAAIREEISEWPDNEYTKAILKPDVGEMDYTLSDENAGYYAVFLKNVTMEDGKQYIQLLKENGFESVSSDSNSVAIGEILKKGTTGLSVSASENVLALYITLNAEEAQ